MTTIELLELHGNLLTGDIPSELGDLSELRDNLDLSSNRLSGPLPSQLGNLVELGRCIACREGGFYQPLSNGNQTLSLTPPVLFVYRVLWLLSPHL